jgi:DNA-binding response OmpR family regulator
MLRTRAAHEGIRAMHLLLVEDDPRLGRLLRRLLEEDRHVVELATTAQEGLTLAEVDGLDAIVLDIGLPDGSGLDVARVLRRAGSAVAILMLTARDAVADRVDGLDAGADDYLVKPFAYQELAARLRALDRRRTPTVRPVPVLASGPISLDESARQVTVAGRAVDLSRREFSLLEVLLRHAGQVLTRDQLLDHAWPSGVAVTLNAVDAYVHLLRTKLGDAAGWVETVRGVGYRLRRP